MNFFRSIRSLEAEALEGQWVSTS